MRLIEALPEVFMKGFWGVMFSYQLIPLVMYGD
jgi:hypothetical protein